MSNAAVLNQLNTSSALMGMPFIAPVSDKAEQALTIALSMIAEQQRRIEQLENETITDALTGLMNKLGFMRAMERELNRANRTGKASAVLVILDLDGLKQVNDSMGHQTGDAYIAGFAEALRKAVRGTDYIARLGGDEFAILLTDVDATRGWKRVETIAIELNSGSVVFKGNKLNVSVSHGAAIVLPNMDTDLIIGDADTRLYDCKTTRKIAQHLEKTHMEMLA